MSLWLRYFLFILVCWVILSQCQQRGQSGYRYKNKIKDVTYIESKKGSTSLPVKTIIWHQPNNTSETSLDPKKCGFLSKNITENILTLLRTPHRDDSKGYYVIGNRTVYEKYMHEDYLEVTFLSVARIKRLFQNFKLKALGGYVSLRTEIWHQHSTTAKKCKDRHNRISNIIDGVNGCILVQFDNSSAPESMRYYPTTMEDLTGHLRLFSSYDYFENLYELVFGNDEFQSIPDRNTREYVNETCVANVHIEGHTASRLIVCVFPPNHDHPWANIREDDYFCPNSLFQKELIQDVSQEASDTTFAFAMEDMAFQEKCHSIISVSQIEKLDQLVHTNLTIETRMNCPRCNKSLSTNHEDFYTFLMASIQRECPSREIRTILPTFGFNVTGTSITFYRYCVWGNYILGLKKPLKPCYFQQHTPDGTCTKYIPLTQAHVTGGLLNDSYSKLFDGKDRNCKVVFVPPQRRCHDKHGHAAVMCSCHSPYCDKPQDSEDIGAMIHERSCMTGVYDDRATASLPSHDLTAIACYFKTTFIDDKPQFTLGFLSPENFDVIMPKGENILNCLTERVACVTFGAADYCCCKANKRGEPACNSIEVAQNNLVTSKLRASVRCSTTMNLEAEDKETCAKRAFTPRICVSEFGFRKEQKQQKLALTRETCDLRTQQKPSDVALTICHSHRKELIEQSGCVSVFIHEADPFIRPSDKKNKVVTCCSPDEYTKTRENFQSKHVITYGDLLAR